MSVVLVSDTSVLVDLHRGSVLDIALELPYDFAVPDLLFDRELRTWDGPALAGRLNVLVLDAAGVELATGYRRTDPRLSLPDAFALALAKMGGHTLLTMPAYAQWLTPKEWTATECCGFSTRLHAVSWQPLSTYTRR